MRFIIRLYRHCCSEYVTSVGWVPDLTMTSMGFKISSFKCSWLYIIQCRITFGLNIVFIFSCPLPLHSSLFDWFVLRRQIHVLFDYLFFIVVALQIWYHTYLLLIASAFFFNLLIAFRSITSIIEQTNILSLNKNIKFNVCIC